jgi:hypothetical protein
VLSGGDGGEKVRGTVVRFEQGNVFFFAFAGFFDGTGYCFTKSLIGSPLPVTIGLRGTAGSSDRLL